VGICKPLSTWIMLFCVTCGASVAQGATYTCTFDKVLVQHPYLPEKLVFRADRMLHAVTLKQVDVANVKTSGGPGVVEHRTPKRVRVSWSSSDYVPIGPLPRQPGSYGRLRPEDYRYTFSLSRSDYRITARIVDQRFGTSRGSADGRCQLRK